MSDHFIVISEKNHNTFSEEEARSRAAGMCLTDGPQSVYRFVDTVRLPKNCASWDSAAQQSSPAPAPFTVGDVVEACRTRIDGAPRNFQTATIIWADTSSCPYEVRFKDGSTGWRCPDGVRRPVTVAAEPKAFAPRFLERVRVGRDIEGVDYSTASAFFLGKDDADHDWRIAIEEADCNYTYFKNDQVFPI